jgi:hypothetical protein
LRIAVFADERELSNYYRAFEPLEALRRHGHSGIINGRDDTIARGMLDCDVALLSRWQGRGAVKLIEQLHRNGIAVVWGHDDAVEEVGHVFTRGALEIQRRRAEIAAMVRAADVVVTTSPRIAASYREMAPTPVHVVENYLGPHYGDLQREPHDGLVLAWAAWRDHQTDWKEMDLHAVVSRLLDEHPQLRIESIGLVDLQLPHERYVRAQPVLFDQLGPFLTRFDIGIAPIADHPFNASRSNIKVKEYAAAGVAWAASPIGPYAGLGERQGGRLVPDDRWYEELDLLIRNARLRRKLAKQGRKWAATQMIERNVDPWEQALMEAIERRRRTCALRGAQATHGS